MESKVLALKNWKLVHDGKDVGKTEEWFKKGIPAKKAVDAEVPGYVHMYLPDCRGVAWYEYTFTNELKASKDELYIIKFDMAEWRTEVYLNGEFVGEHSGTEDPFEFDITKFMTSGENRIDVRVTKPYKDNNVDGYNFYEIPHRNEMIEGLKPGQCFNAYGLSGAVNIVVTPKLYITDTYLFANTETSEIEIEYTVRNSYSKAVEAELCSDCTNKRTGIFVNSDAVTKTFKPGDTKVKRKIKVENFLWWDVDDPNLYNVSTILKSSKTAYRSIKHCGFRTFIVDESNGYFYLNGRRIFLKCSHTGNCMPESVHHISRDKALLRRDFSMAKAAGFNAVRFISGVALPEQLDYCDELGLMVYEEPVASWLLYDSPTAKKIYQHDLFTMMLRDRSHPSITIFGFLNETTTRKPYGKCYMYARNSLKEARKLDAHRLFLYSSGRFDATVSREEMDPWCGSFANPGKTNWQCLWNEDSEDPDEYEPLRKKAGHNIWDFSFSYKFYGDIHHYPNGHITDRHQNAMRTWGCLAKRPVIVSEVGIGSLFNVLWLCRKFETAGYDKKCPDVAVVYKMANDFVEDLNRFGFGDEYAYPVDILHQSEVNNCKQRTQIFNLLRSNPYVNGVSLTGLLDHSVCGEGLFTLMREYKPGMADTLQNGFAPLKWCLFVHDTHAYRNRPFGLEAVLATEDALKPGKYPVSIKVVASDRSVVYSEDITLKVTAKDTKLFSIPVFNKEVTLDVPEGEYEFRAELLEGGAATDSSMKFYITDPANTKATVKSVVGVSLNERTLKVLAENKIKVTSLNGAKANSVILVGEVPEAEREEVWKKLTKLIDKGARVFAASRYSFMKSTAPEATFEEKAAASSYYMPVESKPVNGPFDKHNTDWLYHKEYLAKRGNDYFKGMRTGMMDWDDYCYILSSHCFLYDHGEKLPDEIQSIAVGTGLAWGVVERDLIKGDGIMLGTYNIGSGALTICAFDLIENANINPYADRLLINILNTESSKL